MIRILIADDHSIVRAGLRTLLSGLADSDTGQDHAEELLATAAAERGR